MISHEDRYRTLLGASSAIADQPTVKAILQSLRSLLSSTSKLHGTELYLLTPEEDSLRVLAFDRDVEGPQIDVGTKVLRVGAVARVLEEQEPVFIPDTAQEMLLQPELAPFAAAVGGRSSYLFPVSTSQRQYGFLAVTKLHTEPFVPEDVEILRTLASQVAISLESALARDLAEQYQRELAGERDRLRLLLEINNLIVSKLDMKDMFREASASIRSYFGTDFTALWIFKEEAGQLQSMMHDFPDAQGSLAEVDAADLTAADFEKLRTRKAEIWTTEEIERLPASRRDPLKAESIMSLAVACLANGSKPLGALLMGSRKVDAFGQRDLDLFSQIGNQISLALDNAIAYGRLHASAARLEEERLYLESEIEADYNFEDIVGKSAAIQEVLRQVSIVAPTDSTVLLHGETGTGKELFARAIHTGSPRRERTFVKLNCAAIPSGLLESELFGHEKGAFTGALMQKKGRFEIADHGTLFLDEIGDISMELQPKLLRAVQEREFERLGSTRTINVNVRLIAATHRDIPAMIRNNQFREDLFYRLNVFPIEIPPLRERTGDIPLLVHYFVSHLARRMHKDIKTIPKPAMEALTRSSWPGNVRELENLIERAVILTQGSELNVPVAELKYASSAPGTTTAISTFEDAERQAIIDALKAASGKLAGEGGAASRLGLKRTTLQNKMRRLNISRADYTL